ncbi:MAG: Short-chain dehydrogenase [Conexibacter sp.]|nr:Short-chain dehydrogenase [Conexibacter sp.]
MMATQDMQGRTVVITGASAGLGAVAAQRLAERGATVVPVGRSPEKTAAVARTIGVEPLVADFARLDDVRRLADALLERCEQIDVLANNAGGIFPRRVETVDGHELTFQVNHLAPFLLTTLLHERLAATPGSRVLMTSSVGNNLGNVKLDDLDRRRGPYVSLRAYGTAKLENILMAREIARRWTGDGIAATAFHPGNVATEFGRDSFSSGLIYRTPLRRVFLITPEEGAAALVGLATQPDAAALDGVYFDRFKPHGRMSKQADDAELARGLWERSAALVGVAA